LLMTFISLSFDLQMLSSLRTAAFLGLFPPLTISAARAQIS
jgi:hypothetical protein